MLYIFPGVRKIPLAEEMATHSSILAQKIPWTEEPGRVHSMRLQESDTTEHIHAQVAQWVKNTPAMQEMPEKWVQSLGQEDPLEEGMATHSSILAWRISWTEEAGG